MQTVKQAASELIGNLPDQVTWDDVMYEIYVKQKLEEGLRDLNEGRIHTQDEVEHRLLGKTP